MGIGTSVCLLNRRILKLVNRMPPVNISNDINTMSAARIGVIQLCSTNQKNENFQHAKEYILKAKTEGANMVFLPECFDFVGHNRQETFANSEAIDGPLISKYRQLAIDTRLWMSLGGLHRAANNAPANEDNRIYNTHIILNPDGQIVCTYDKSHLFDAKINPSGDPSAASSVGLQESLFVQPGLSAPPIVENTPVGRLGLAICYDVRFPELSSHLRYVGGAQTLAYPAAFSRPTGEAGHWHHLLHARAIETQCYVIAAAQEGQHNPKRASYGHSIVINPWGQVVAERNEPGPGLLMCEIGPFVEESVQNNWSRALGPSIYSIRHSLPVEFHRRFDLFFMPDSARAEAIGSANYAFGDHIIPSSCVFYRSPLSFAFVNISPLVPGHCLVSPIACVPRFDDLSRMQVADLYLTVKQIAGRLAEYFSATSLTISIQDGKDAGQSVPHVHIHVLPRKPNDFAQNDDIYTALQTHDKVANRVYRSESVMSAEATQLRSLFYSEVS